MPVVDLNPVPGPTPSTGGALATLAQLRTFLDDPDLDATRGNLFIQLAAGEVRAYTGNNFTFVEDDTILLNGTGSNTLLLPEIPVSAVSSIVAGPSSGAPYTINQNAYDWDEDGVVELRGWGRFLRRRRWYAVTYDHGFTTVPDEVTAVVLRIAAAGFDSPTGETSETLGKYSYTVAGEQAGLGLNDADRAVLAPYMVGTRPRSGTGAPAGS